MPEAPPLERSAAAPAEQKVGLGIASILSAVLLFSIADAAAKWLGQSYAPIQIVFLRYVFGLIPVAVFIWHAGGLYSIRTERPAAHAARACLIFTALFGFFTGLQAMPLAEAIAIAFTAPLFVTALSAPILKEPVGPRRWAAVIVGFLGALIMVRPGAAAFRFEAFYILGSAFCFASAMLLTRRMARSETNVSMITYTTIGAGLASLPFVTFAWQTPVAGDLWLFALLGLLGSCAAYFVVVAYRNAPAAVVAPFDYSALIWGTLFGWILWREQPDLIVWIGAAVVAGSGLYITHREARGGRRKT